MTNHVFEPRVIFRVYARAIIITADGVNNTFQRKPLELRITLYAFVLRIAAVVKKNASGKKKVIADRCAATAIARALPFNRLAQTLLFHIYIMIDRSSSVRSEIERRAPRMFLEEYLINFTKRIQPRAQ